MDLSFANTPWRALSPLSGAGTKTRPCAGSLYPYRPRVRAEAASGEETSSKPLELSADLLTEQLQGMDVAEVQGSNPGPAERKKRVSKSARKERMKIMSAKKNSAVCYGCGAELQTDRADSPGYVTLETYTMKKAHRQLHTLLCGRCRQLAQGEMVPAVGGHGGYGPESELFVTADELREQLSFLRTQRALMVKLVDIVDFQGSFLNRVRDLVGANPIILVITKIDLLPEETDLEAVGDWVLEILRRKKLNVVSVHLTSAKTPSGIPGVAGAILRERQGRDVYVMGAANVGKSCFISALLEEMAKRDFFAASARKRKPIASAMPGTTLGTIPLRVFAGTSSLYDTAGVHLHHRMPAVVLPLDLPKLAPKRRLRGYVPSPADRGDESDSETEGAPGMEGTSAFWGGIARLDVLMAPPSVTLTFYGATGIKVRTATLQEADEFYEEELGTGLVPPSEGSIPADWEGLPQFKDFEFNARVGSRPCGDIAISGLGWVTVSGVSKSDPQVSREEKGVTYPIQIRVHVPRGIEVFSRAPIPIGEQGRQWYQFADLTEEEELNRPRVFFDSQDA